MENRETKILNTPIGEIEAFTNDSFTKQVEQLGFYAEQIILENNIHPYIEKANLILDIGGHVGYHSIYYSMVNSNCKIKTFEPQKRMFGVLNNNIRNKNLKNIETFNLAVGHENKEINISSIVTDGPNSNEDYVYGGDIEYNLGGVGIGYGGEIAKMITVDSLNLPCLDYMKIDVEGAESLVLIGARETILKYKPVICFEFNHKRISSEYLKEIGIENLPTPHEILESYGYTSFENIQYENIIARVK